MSLSSNEVRNWSMLCHISALAVLLFSWGGIIGPLIVWLLKRNESSTIDEHGKESLNFQITLYIIYFILGLVLMGTVGMGALFGSPFSILSGGLGISSLLTLVQLIGIVLVIVAGVTANNGGFYKYPFSLRLIK
jgi:uncharacterized Tic20 family protein